MKMVDEHLVFLNVEGLDSKDKVLDYLSKKLLEAGIVKKSYIQAIKDREIIFPTGLQFPEYGVAVPHTDCDYVEKTDLALVTLRKPVEFVHMATEDIKVPVRIVIMLSIKEPHKQVEMLQKLIEFLQNEEEVKKILNGQLSIKEIGELLEKIKRN